MDLDSDSVVASHSDFIGLNKMLRVFLLTLSDIFIWCLNNDKSSLVSDTIGCGELLFKQQLL